MMRAPLWTTVRAGICTVVLDSETSHEFDVRVLRGADGGYWVLFAGALSKEIADLAAAVSEAEQPNMSGGARSSVRWRGPTLEPGESPCPICGAAVDDTPRYPNRLGPACKTETADRTGRLLQFSDGPRMGGLIARYADDGSRCNTSECFVRGARCVAKESYYGGWVVQPMGQSGRKHD